MIFIYVGLILYTSTDKTSNYDIAEAPFDLVQNDNQLKPLSGRFKLSCKEIDVDHVRLRAIKQDHLEYGIEELFKVDLFVVAVLLINLSDTLILDSKVIGDLTTINVPVYVVSSADGKEIMQHISKKDECQCSFLFSSNGKEHLSNY